ncbi:MAG: hypothetical protein CM15mP81_18780 [Alphaproteobacteria bacterium]|nr:MAG: hypothetical protein CM15mP81_18780 [Alphaproteobacteria bacterium]
MKFQKKLVFMKFKSRKPQKRRKQKVSKLKNKNKRKKIIIEFFKIKSLPLELSKITKRKKVF